MIASLKWAFLPREPRRRHFRVAVDRAMSTLLGYASVSRPGSVIRYPEGDVGKNGDAPEMITSAKWKDFCFATLHVKGMLSVLTGSDDGFRPVEPAFLDVVAPRLPFRMLRGLLTFWACINVVGFVIIYIYIFGPHVYMYISWIILGHVYWATCHVSWIMYIYTYIYFFGL